MAEKPTWTFKELPGEVVVSEVVLMRLQHPELRRMAFEVDKDSEGISTSVIESFAEKSRWLWELSDEDWNELAHKIAIVISKMRTDSSESRMQPLSLFAKDYEQFCKFKNDVENWISRMK